MPLPLSRRALNLTDLEALCPWIPAGPVFDAGCGEGTLARVFARYGFAVEALDADADALAKLSRAHPEIVCRQGDLRAAELPPEHYAAIVCHNVLPFLPQSEHGPLLRRIAAALKPGGVLIFSGFNRSDAGAGAQLALTRAGQPTATGLSSLRGLRQRFAGWDWWFAFEGRVADDHPPVGPHWHGLSQAIVRKPVPELGPVDWARLPTLGAGMGWRSPLQDWLLQPGRTDFLEIMTDDYLDPRYDGRLLELSRQFRVIPHGVELSIGTPDGVDAAYLDDVARIAARCDSPWWSDHLCYTRTSRHKTFSLNPLPATAETQAIVVANLREVRRRHPRPLLLENAAYYAPLAQSEFSDAELLTRIALEADCGILLDVANLYGNARNLGLDPYAFVDALPAERVIQLHLAGGRVEGGILFDTHDQPIWRETWELLSYVLKRCDVKAISIERDDNYTGIESLIGELDTSRQLLGARL